MNLEMSFVAVALTVLLQSGHQPAEPSPIGEGFSIVFPSSPHLADPTKKPPDHTWITEVHGAKFVANVSPRPRSPVSDLQLEREIAQSFGGSINGSLAFGQEYVFQGWLGLPFHANSAEQDVEARIFLTDKWLVVAAVIGPSAQTPNESQAFLSSLSLPKSEQGPHTSAELAAPNKPLTCDIGDGFKATFPTEPTKSTRLMNGWEAATKEGIFVTQTDLAPPATEDADSDDQGLADAMQVQVGVQQGKVTRMLDILVDGWPGIEFEGTGRAGRFWCRICRFHKKYTTLLVLYEGGAAPPGARPFLESLQVPNTVGTGPYKIAGPTFKTYQDQEAGLSIEFPTPPERTVRPPVDASTEAPFVRFESAYGDRDYGFAFSRFSPAVTAKMTAQQVDSLLDKAIKTTFRDMTLREVRRSSSFAGGIKWLSAEGANDDGLAGRVDVVFRNGTLYIFGADVAESLLHSPEVARFFSSIKWLDAK